MTSQKQAGESVVLVSLELFLPTLISNHVTKRVLEEGQASRPISTGQLHVLPRFHTQPIKLVVYKWPTGTEVQGYLILGLASRLDAFSGYRFRI